jgi:DNA-directed RNA polymerase subunit RPC12/RpoP
LVSIVRYVLDGGTSGHCSRCGASLADHPKGSLGLRIHGSLHALWLWLSGDGRYVTGGYVCSNCQPFTSYSHIFGDDE